MTLQQPDNQQSADSEVPDTEVIAVAAPAPVFVDSTGRRSRLLRRLAYAFGVLVMLYGGLICVSLAGGPVSSSAVLPLPGLENDDNDGRAPARPAPVPAPDPNPSQSAKALFATGTLPRRTSPAGRAPTSRVESTRVPPKPLPTPAPSRTPKPTGSTSHPVESTTTTKPPSTPTGPATTPTSKAPLPPTGPTVAAPVPPAAALPGPASEETA